MGAEAVSIEGLSKGGPGGCHQGGRGQVVPEASAGIKRDFWPVGKIYSPFLGDRVPAGVQEEEVFKTVRQAVRTFRNQYRYFYLVFNINSM